MKQKRPKKVFLLLGENLGAIYFFFGNFPINIE